MSAAQTARDDFRKKKHGSHTPCFFIFKSRSGHAMPHQHQFLKRPTTLPKTVTANKTTAPSTTPTPTFTPVEVKADNTPPMPSVNDSIQWCNNGTPCVMMPPPTMNMAAVPTTVNVFIKRGANHSKNAPNFREPAFLTPFKADK